MPDTPAILGGADAQAVRSVATDLGHDPDQSVALVDALLEAEIVRLIPRVMGPRGPLRIDGMSPDAQGRVGLAQFKGIPLATASDEISGGGE